MRRGSKVREGALEALKQSPRAICFDIELHAAAIIESRFALPPAPWDICAHARRSHKRTSVRWGWAKGRSMKTGADANKGAKNPARCALALGWRPMADDGRKVLLLRARVPELWRAVAGQSW